MRILKIEKSDLIHKNLKFADFSLSFIYVENCLYCICGDYMKRIVWDWNGTLFDDIKLCFECINRLLCAHDLTPLDSVEKYRNVFDFPIQSYYEKIGFDFNKVSFEILADEYMEDYQEKSFDCSLHEDVLDTISSAQSYGIEQIILSASEKENLLSQIHLFPLKEYFDESKIYGIDDIYAHSKLDLAKRYMKQVEQCNKTWFVGDSLHDAEVAKAVHANSVLVSTGHQSEARLKEAGVPVFSSVRECLEYINGRD